jgi:hypothetical protein
VGSSEGHCEICYLLVRAEGVGISEFSCVSTPGVDNSLPSGLSFPAMAIATAAEIHVLTFVSFHIALVRVVPGILGAKRELGARLD